MKIKFLVYMALAAAASTASHAAIIYDSGVPRGNSPGISSDISGGLLIADDFVLSSGATTFNRITWWGVYAVPGSNAGGVIDDNFTISIHESANGVPFTNALETYSLGAVSRVEAGPWGSSNTYYKYVADISSTSLQADTKYYLSIWNNTAGMDENWYWLSTPDNLGPETTYHRNRLEYDWVYRGTDQLAYNLSNEPAPPVVPVPAPAMLGLLGIGLVGLARRFRKQAA